MFDERVPRAAALGGFLTLLAVAPAFAQAVNPEEGRYRERGPLLFVNGGGFSALTDVTREGLDFKTGYNLGGGLGDPTVGNRDRTQWDSTWSAGVRYVF